MHIFSQSTDDGGYDWNIGVIDGVNYYSYNMATYTSLTYEQRIEKLMKGALYRYVPNPKVYRCPEAIKIVHRTYVYAHLDECTQFIGTGLQRKEGMVFKRTGEIKKSAQRMVFIEEKIMTPDAMQIRADQPWWEDYPDWPGLCMIMGLLLDWLTVTVNTGNGNVRRQLTLARIDRPAVKYHGLIPIRPVRKISSNFRWLYGAIRLNMI